VRRVAGALCAVAGALLTLLVGACTPASPQRPETTPTDSAALYNVQLGVAYLQQGNLAIAQDKLERALKENPRDPNVHNALALLYERLDQPEKVDGEYREALRLAPRNPDISNNYGVYLCQHGRVDEGVRRLEAVARNPLYRTPETAYTNAGVCLRTAKRIPEAERDLLRALALKPANTEAALQLGEMYLDVGRLADARKRVDAHLDAYPATPEMLWLGVRVMRALGDRLAAEHYGRQLRRDFPNSDQARAFAALGSNPG
jgi:type IV pilus assembly protein PilF